MKNLTHSNKGITLIALVITIIVLLILAAVSIATLTGENGILTKASSAAEAQKKAEVKEKVQVEVLASYDNNGKLNMETLKANLKSHLGVNDITTNDDGSISFILDGYNVTVTTEGIVTVGNEAEKEEEKPSIIQAESITVDDLTIAPGEKQKLNVTTNPEYITEELEYTSEDQNKATVETDGTITGVEEGTTTITVTGKTSKKSGQCTVTVEMKTLASQINANNYGDPVAYDIDLDGKSETNDWKIFYKDGDRVFLIAADYLDYTKNEDKLNLTETKDKIGLKKAYEENGKYSLNWDESKLPTVESAGIDNSLFKATGYDITKHSDNPNAKCVSELLNTNYWSNFVNPSYADKAIGSPTLEMWVASWNAKGSINGTNGIANLTASPIGGSGTGYNINGNETFSVSTSGTEADKTGYHDPLYFPYHIQINELEALGNGHARIFETYGYWLASPSDVGGKYLCFVSYNGYVTYDDYVGPSGGVRPIVCLKSDIKGKNESGVWKLATKH